MGVKISETKTIILQAILMAVLLMSLGLILQGCAGKSETTSKNINQGAAFIYAGENAIVAANESIEIFNL